MNIIKTKVDFTKGTCTVSGINLVEGDYNSTKIEFTFDREDGTKVFEMKSPSEQLVAYQEIYNNEIILYGLKDVTTEHNSKTYTKYTKNDAIYWYQPTDNKLFTDAWVEVVTFDLTEYTKATEKASIFTEEGNYIFEISLYEDDSKLTSASGKIKVKAEQVKIGDNMVTPYIPIFDELMQDVETALGDIEDKITEVNTAITQTNNLDLDVSKSGKVATVTLTKKDNTTKTVTLSDGTSLQFNWDGTKLGVKTDNDESYTYVDLKGETGETGATPSLSIGTVSTGSPSAVTITGTDENPVLNFTLEKGETGATGATGNGIASIVKTSTSGTVDTYTITYTDGTTTTFNVTNGEVSQAQLDELQAQVDRYKMLENALPHITGSGESVTLDNTANAGMTIDLEPSELTQATSILPSEYQQVEYIENLNNRYFDTGFKPNNNTKVEAVASVNELTSNGKFLFATRNSARTDIFCGLFWTDNKVAGGYGNSGLYQSEVVQNVNEKFTLTLDKNLLYHNGTLLQTFNTQTFTSENNLYLFTANTAGSPDTQIFKGKLYSCKIYDNGTLIRDFIPCYKISDNTIGLYDIVNNQFYTNLGTGTIQKGNNVTSPNPDYPQDIHVVSGDNEVVVGNKNLSITSTYLRGLIDGSGKYSTNGTTDININNNTITVTTTTDYRGSVSDWIEVKSNTAYILSYNGDTLNANYYSYLNWYDKDKTFIQRDSGNVYRTSPANAKYVRIFIMSNLIGTFSISNIQLEQNSAATTYEPHEEQVVNIPLGVKNLLPLSASDLTFNAYINSSDGNYATTTSGNYYASAEYIDFINYAGKTVTLSEGLEVAFYNNSKTFISYIGRAVSRTQTIPSNTAYIRIDCYKDNINKMQIEEGTKQNSYTPYGTETIEYCKIPNTDYKDRIFKNVVGDVDYDSSRELGKWYLKKNVGNEIINLTGAINTLGNGNKYTTFYVNNKGTEYNDVRSLCSNATIRLSDKSNAQDGEYYQNQNNFVFVGNSTDTLQTMKQKYDGGLLYYVLANPEYIPLNNTLQNALNTLQEKLLAYKGQTNISQVNNDLPFEIVASALKDISNL